MAYHDFMGTSNEGEDAHGYSSRCSCGWRGNEYRGGNQPSYASFLYEHMNHRMNELIADIRSGEIMAVNK